MRSLSYSLISLYTPNPDMPKRTGTWYAPRASKMARYTPRKASTYSRARPSKFKAYSKGLNGKRFSIKPTRFPRIAKSAGYAKYAQTRTFTNMVFESLDLMPGSGPLAGEFRSNSLAFYPKLSFFAGFEQMMVLYEMCKPISMTVRARICKISGVGGRDTASLNYTATPNQTGGAQGSGALVNVGSMPSPGLFDFMEVRSCVDYDGKEGKGGTIPYDFLDYVNAGNTALGYINGKYLKTVAQFVPRQYVDNSTQLNSGQPLMDKSQFYPQHTFLTYNAQTQAWAPSVTEPKFGGVNLFATSYDAVSNGYNGKLGDNNPCLTIQYYVDLKVAFKGKIKNKDVTDITQIIS